MSDELQSRTAFQREDLAHRNLIQVRRTNRVNNMPTTKTTISMNLPDSVMLGIAQRAQKNGFSDVGEFVSQMIAQINERQAQVQKLGSEGIESGPSEPWSTSEIDAIRKDLRSKQGS